MDKTTEKMGDDTSESGDEQSHGPSNSKRPKRDNGMPGPAVVTAAVSTDNPSTSTAITLPSELFNTPNEFPQITEIVTTNNKPEMNLAVRRDTDSHHTRIVYKDHKVLGLCTISSYDTYNTEIGHAAESQSSPAGSNNNDNKSFNGMLEIISTNTEVIEEMLINITRKFIDINNPRTIVIDVKQIINSDSGDENSDDSDSPSAEPMPSTSGQFRSGDTKEEETMMANAYHAYQKNLEKENAPELLYKGTGNQHFGIVREIMNRELGISVSRNATTSGNGSFTQRFNSSLHATKRMQSMSVLQMHRCFINSLNFSHDGKLLVSGSDDNSVIIWDWARRKALYGNRTFHKSSVLQTKFLYSDTEDELDIVTSCRGGHVSTFRCDSAGGLRFQRNIAEHDEAVNSLYVSSLERDSVFSAGQDGYVVHCDLRTNRAKNMIDLNDNGHCLPIYSVHGHPHKPMELMIAAHENFVRVYDRRRIGKPLALYCPTPLTEKPKVIHKTLHLTSVNLTSAFYNYDGSEILASYNNEAIYLFNTETDQADPQKQGYSFRYSGHRNSSIYRPAIFYGPKSEYIIAGSDCGNIFIWDKETESIVHWLKGDIETITNTIEPHPSFPILATGGFYKNVMIWMPQSQRDPVFIGLHRTVIKNGKTKWQTSLFNEFLPWLYKSWMNAYNVLSHQANSLHDSRLTFETTVPGRM